MTLSLRPGWSTKRAPELYTKKQNNKKNLSQRTRKKKKKDFLLLQYEEEDAPLEQFHLTASVNLVRREIYLLAGALLRPHGLLELEHRLRMMTNE